MRKIENPLRVFISSVMYNETEPERDLITGLRASLYKRLSKYKFIEPYILENDVSSPINLVDTYKSVIRDTNIVIFLIDSRFPISEGVSIEISEARRINKSRLFYILGGNEKENESMRQKLLKQGETVYINPIPVSKKKNYPLFLEDSFLSQMVLVYRSYLDKTISENNRQDDDKYYEDSSISSLDGDINIDFEKNIFRRIGKTKNIIDEMIFHDNEIKSLKEPESSLDLSVSDIVDRIFLNKPLPQTWERTLIETIKNSELNFGKIRLEITIARIHVIYLYYSGDYINAFDELKKVLQNKNIDQIPTWLFQDILIDLRNLSNLIDSEENRINFNNEFQKQLDETPNVFYYPIIDNILKQTTDWAFNQTNESFIASSNSQTAYGPGIHEYSNKLANAATIAVLNGSLTQIKLIPNNLMPISKMLLFQTKNPIYLRDIIQDYLTLNKKYSTISKWINKYSRMVSTFTSADANSILLSAKSCPIHSQKIRNISNALNIIGNYLDDVTFDKEWGSLFSQIKQWIESEDVIVAPFNDIFKMFQGLFRIPQKDIVLFIERVANGKLRFYSETYKVIALSIDFEKQESKNIGLILSSMMRMLESEQKHWEGTADGAIISVISSWPNESKELISFLKEKSLDTYNKRILPYIDDERINENSYWNEIFKKMRSQNLQQTKSSSSFGSDPFLSAYNVIENNGIDKVQIDDLITLIIECIMNPYQFVDVKCSALKTLWLLLANSKISIKYKKIIKNKIEISEINAIALNFFQKRDASTIVETIKYLLDVSLNDASENGNKILLAVSMDKSMEFLENLSDLLVDFIRLLIQEPQNKEFLPLCVQFLITNNSIQNDTRVLVNIAKSLIILSNYQEYNDIAIGQLQIMVSDSDDIVRRKIVVLISKYSKRSDNSFKNIKAQLLNSSNYSVRDLAKRLFQE